MRVGAVTLDAAGTLFDVAEPVGVTYARVAGHHGVPLVAEDVERRFRAAMAAGPPLAFPGAGASDFPERERAWWRDVVREALGPAAAPVADACFADLFAYYARAAAWRLYPEVRGALEALRTRGLRLAVVSNFDGRLEGILAGLGLSPFLDHVLHSSRAGCAKPDARIFRAAVAALGVPLRRALHAGDSLGTDVEGARAAGLRAALVDRAGRRPPLPPDVAVIGSLAELPALLDQESDRLF